MTPDPIRAGDAALLLELEPRIDAEVNARAIGIADDVRRRRLAGVRDVISTYRSVAVHFDPLRADADAVGAALRRAYEAGVTRKGGREIEVPVAYGGEGGPDLAAVAAFGRMSESEVIRCHSQRSYRVFMLGFMPGFAYMGLVDPRVAAPRHATPRLKVPAGSVGIAGSQTGIYPRESPGGWQIIGHTEMTLVDRNESPLLAPGDSVTFIPSPANRARSRNRAIEAGSRTAPSARTVTVVAPGLLTSVQSLGCWGRQHEGVPVGGAMDAVSHRVANRCVGNPDTAATLEVTMLGPEVRTECAATVAIAGADLQATIDGSPVTLRAPMTMKPGATLRFGTRQSGARAYVAFDGGIDAPMCYGRRLHAGDRLSLARAGAQVLAKAVPRLIETRHPVLLRVIPGPQTGFFDDRGLDTLTRSTFTVSPRSDRMGYRLASTSPIARASTQEMISDATFLGGVQITPAGQAILLMADRPTTGGYPQMATVISADMLVAAQLAPGDSFRFVVCTPREAVTALAAQEGQFGAHE